MAALEVLDQVVRGLAQPVAGAILLNQLDDLFVDANYFLRGLHRRARRVLSPEALRQVEQKRVAIMVPAWLEADVIGRMLEHNRAAIDFDEDRFDFFCGTYANDPETQARVDEVARRDRGIHKVVVPHDGPTSKADCLNWIYQGVIQEEQRRGVAYDVLLMHDAEDVIHPLALRLYSLLIPEHDFVQTPVFSLELAARQAVAGTYIDEFGEHHLKDLRVRQAIGGLVPSAGVGSAFERRAFAEIAARHGQRPFNVESLTEDYEIGLKFRLAGKKVCFACHTLEREVTDERGILRKRPVRARREEYIATREYFPDGFSASVRQRSRWILGIALQAWEQIGWQGPPAVRYCLWRDRKGLLNSVLLIVAYFLVAYVLLRGAHGAAVTGEWRTSSLVAPGSLLALVLGVNLAGMAWRALLKLHFVTRLYGPLQGLLAVPRLVLMNLISIAATARAARTYLKHRITGEPLRWLKTAHAFPSVEALAARRKRLGDLLVEREALAVEDLEAALALQREVPLPLGEVLALSGALPERRVLRGLAAQLDLETCRPDPADVCRELLRRLPEAEAEALDVLPWRREGEMASVAMRRPLSPRQRAWLEERLGTSIRSVLADPRSLRRSRAIAYRRLLPFAPAQPMLGQRLVALRRLDGAALEQLLEEQLDTGELLGELLLRSGRVAVEDLAEALAPEGGFHVVTPDAADRDATERLRHAWCALHGLVPLTRSLGARVVAAAWPVHPAVAARVVERLGEEVAFVPAGSLPVRVALAVAERTRPPWLGPGRDGAELAALASRGLAESPSALLGAARSRRSSPIDHLEAEGVLDGLAAASLRAEVLGIEVAAGDGRGAAGPSGVLPPGFACENRIAVVEAAAGALVLAAPRPTAALARRVAHLMPGWRIAWEVLPQRGQPREGGRHARA